MHGEPTSWDFTKNPILTGQLVGYRDLEGKFGPFRVVQIRKEDGQLVDFILKHTVLKNQLERQDAQPGDSVGIKYLGKHPKKGYHNYIVVVDKSG